MTLEYKSDPDDATPDLVPGQAQKIIRWGHTHHYTIRSFSPPEEGDTRMGMWGFDVELDPHFALCAKNFARPDGYLERLSDQARGIAVQCMRTDHEVAIFGSGQEASDHGLSRIENPPAGAIRSIEKIDRARRIRQGAAR